MLSSLATAAGQLATRRGCDGIGLRIHIWAHLQAQDYRGNPRHSAESTSYGEVNCAVNLSARIT